MNLKDFRTRVLENLGDDGATWAPSDSPGGDQWDRVDRLINDAQRELAVLAERVDPTFNVKDSRLPISDEESWTPLDVVGYLPAHSHTPLPEDFRRIVSLWRTDTGIAKKHSEVQIVPRRRALFYAEGANGPDVAYLQNDASSGGSSPSNLIYVVGASPASHTWNLWYAARLADLANELDECQLPEEYHHLVPMGAALRAFLQENSDAASSYRAMYDQGVAALAVALPRRDGAGAPT